MIFRRIPVQVLARWYFTFCSRLHSTQTFGWRVRSSLTPLCARSILKPGTRVFVTEILPKESLEGAYFKTFMSDSEKYPHCTVSESFLSDNAASGNRVVALLRALVRGETAATGDCEGFNDEGFTEDDLIEGFHHLSKLSERELDPELKRILRATLLKNLMRVRCSDRGKLLKLVHQVCLVEPTANELYHISAKIFRKLHILSTSQIVEYFYFLHIYKKSPVKKESRFIMEKILTSRMRDMTMNELTVIGQALFRCKVSPSSLLSAALAERTAREFENLNLFQATMMCKIISYGNGNAVKESINEILHKFVPMSDYFHMTAATRIACTGIHSGLSSFDLVERLFDRGTREMNSMRIKDIERLLLAACHCNYRLTKDCMFVQALIKRLKETKEELVSFPISYISTLTYLIIQGIFLDDFIGQIFLSVYPTSTKDPTYGLPRVTRKNARHFVFVDYSLEIERPDYSGPRMPERPKLKFIKMEVNTLKSEMLSMHTAGNQLYSILQELYSKESFAMVHPLPHYSTFHLILGFDDNNKLVRIDDKIKKEPWGTLVKAPQDGNRWLTFLFFKWDNYISDGVTLNLISEAKIRQFRATGYHPITVH